MMGSAPAPVEGERAEARGWSPRTHDRRVRSGRAFVDPLESEATMPFLACTLGLLLTVLPAPAQCLGWTGDFDARGVAPRTPTGVLAAIVFDDGDAPRLVVGGHLFRAGSELNAGCARWGRSGWAQMPPTSSSAIDAGEFVAFEVFDGGAGHDLVGAHTGPSGAPHRLLRWTGADWTDLATSAIDGRIESLRVFDDGSGPALYYGGAFATTGALATPGVGRWDGSAFSTVGTGLVGTVRALEVFDDGNGAALYAAGRFDVAGQLDQGLARWNGATWSGLGTAGGGEAYALEVHDDGSGASLYVGGDFTSLGGVETNGLGKWNGQSWSALGSGFDGTVRAVRSFDDGSGPALYAGGEFATAGGVAAFLAARWDGGGWSDVATDFIDFAGTGIHALEVYDDGRGPRLYALGYFVQTGPTPARHIAAWDGTSWKPEAAGGQVDGPVEAMAVANLGNGPGLYVAGRFTNVGGLTQFNHVTRWDGRQHERLPAAPSSSHGTNRGIFALATHDDGTGTALYAGGAFTTAGGLPASHVARWNGSSWSTVGAGLDEKVLALAAFDDGGGPRLFAGGSFDHTDGAPAPRIACWDGASWSRVGTGFDGDVLCLVVHDDGSGPALFAGGEFVQAGAVATSHVARWRGAATGWEPLGSGTDGTVRALAVHDDGTGAALWVGGDFATAGGLSSPHVARWDGLGWTPLPPGPEGPVQALRSYQDGQDASASLYATGSFERAAGVVVDHVAEWNGTGWQLLGPGLNAIPGTEQGGRALAVFDDGSGRPPALVVGGSFRPSEFSANDGSTPVRGNLAMWHDPCLGGPGNVLSYCQGELHSGGCVARIDSDGTPSATGTAPFQVHARDMIPGSSGFVLYGFQKANLPFHGGVLCVKAPIQRLLPPVTAVASGPPPCTGVLTRDFNKRIQAGGDPLLSAGQRVFAQWLQRDPLDPGGGGQALTDGVSFVITP